MLVGFQWMGKYTEGRLASVVKDRQGSFIAVIWHPTLRWLTKRLEEVEPQFSTGREQ